MGSVDFILWMRADELGDRGKSWSGIIEAILDGVFTGGEMDELIGHCAVIAGYRNSGKHSWLRNVRRIRHRLAAERRLTPAQTSLVRDCGYAADCMLRAGRSKA